MTQTLPEERFVQCIEYLKHNHSKSDALSTLEHTVISSSQASALLDVVMDLSFPLSVKDKKVVLNLLRGDIEVNQSYIFRILSSVGYPRVYYQEGKRIKQKKLQLSLQTALLDWAVSNIYVFGYSVFKTLHKLSAVLFNLLSFEFCRLQICHLIFLTFSNTNKTFKFSNGNSAPILKHWQIKIVVDLALKFPLDRYLRTLLAAFKYMVPGLDYKKYTDRYKELSGRSTYDNTFEIPFETKSDPITSESSTGTRKRILDTCITQYRHFNGANKRRKRNTKNWTNYHNALSINDITGLSDLVWNLQDVVVDYAEVVESGELPRVKYDYIIMKYLVHGADKNFQFQVSNSQQVNGLQKILQTSSISIPIPNRDPKAVLGLLPYLNAHNASMDGEKGPQWDDYFESHKESAITALNRIFTKLIAQNKPWIDTFNKVVPLAFKKVRVHDCSIAGRLNLVSFLQIYRRMDQTDLARLAPEAVLLPIWDIYTLLFTMNPLVFSEACGYIFSIKKYPFNEEYKRVYNSITMDILNFIWRDKAFFKQTRSLHQAMYLDDQFVNKLSMMNVFNKSKLVELDNVGNLFHNPIWSLVVTELVWEIEDEHPGTITRHPGPITPESIAMVLQDETVSWMDTSYEEVKVQVLQKLQLLGYTGLCDFLFGSLRSLQNVKR